jgi:hypothetical protein
MSAVAKGLCQCGCGEQTNLATVTRRARNQRVGEPLRFIDGHFQRTKIPADKYPNPTGKCGCGCGKTTPIATRSDVRKNIVRGQHLRYLKGHAGCYAPGPRGYIEEDRGYKTPCWIWQQFTHKNGYGQVHFEGRQQGAHRMFYTKFRGEIPPGFEVDHLCFVPSCVNPEHLEAVTPQVNKQRQRIHGRETRHAKSA